MSSSFYVVSLKNIHNLCFATFSFLLLRVLLVGTLSSSLGSSPSSEGVLTGSGRYFKGLGLGLSALSRARSIFGICTRIFTTLQDVVDSVGIVDRCSEVPVDQFGMVETDTYPNQPRASSSMAIGPQASQARSLSSHRARTQLGRHVATEREPKLSHYIATERAHGSDQGLQTPEHLSSDLLHYTDDPPGHAGLHSYLVQVSKSQPSLASQYRSMSGMAYRSMSGEGCWATEGECCRSTVVSEYRSTELVSGSTVVEQHRATHKYCCRSMRNALPCGSNVPNLQDQKVLIDNPIGISIDTPFAPSIDYSSDIDRRALVKLYARVK
ncbi:hypothetical protein F2Q69_00012846 [Brassica cretica]|uniref:Uncharacterized protein n=1 Tax=Brassica cretica TaxID=69181 RepID=A0A8S9QUX9_BRACR|nr:hypothetical protein F2Q69_00012846 [Brassica cretica]